MKSSNPSRVYWRETSRPLVNLAFVAPLLIAYEGGLLLLGPRAMRNGADIWLREFLDFLGFSQYFLLPLMTCGLLLGWHHVARESWRFRGGVLYGMLVESLAFGSVLLVVAQLLHGQFAGGSPAAANVLASASDAVSFVGAGIYEELVFRLILLSVLVVGLRWIGVSRVSGLAMSIAICSIVFAAAHYRFELSGDYWLAPTAEPFLWPVFCFRFLAGVFFSLLFLWRGFGIAVGAHALYDILVAC